MISIKRLTLILTVFGHLAATAPTDKCLADPSCGLQAGEITAYSDSRTVEPPWPGNTTGAILNTTCGTPGPDDLLFQNLLSAEWIIFSFYQQGVERFNQTSFTDAGYPNSTYDRIAEIRDNEAGHLRIFQNQISTNSVKPGPCQYEFPYIDATSYLALQTIIEVSSMAFLTGLELQAELQLSRGALVAIAATESRHNTWSLIDNWEADPFAGPSDTYFPYANQILAFTSSWVIAGSCPPENPVYPSPQQQLPQLGLNKNTTTSIAPGVDIELVISGGDDQAKFTKLEECYAVFFHGLLNVSVPLSSENMTVTIPPELEAKGIFIVVIADQEGAPSKDSVLAGPLVLLEDPEKIGVNLI